MSVQHVGCKESCFDEFDTSELAESEAEEPASELQEICRSNKLYGYITA